MNWIKASTRRAKEEFLQTVGHHQGTVDAEFDAAELHYQQVFKDLQKVQETVQMWSDCMDTAFAASLGTGEVVARFFASLGNASSKVEMDSPARTYMAIQSDINEKLRKPMHRVLLERCLRPITELLAVAPVLNDKLSARKKALLDVDFYTSKYAGEAEQGREKNEPKMARLAAKLEAATKNLEEIENELIAAFEEIEVSKTQLLRSEISTFFACHFYLLQTSANMMSDLIGVSPYSAASLCALEAERSHESFLYKETIEQPRAVSASRNNERGDDAINALSSALRDTSPVARLKHARASTSAVRAANVAAATAAAAEPYEGKKSGSAGARLASVSGAISTGLRRLSMVSSNKGAAQPSMGASKPVKTIESQKSGPLEEVEMDTAPHAGFSSRIDETESNRSSDASDTPASESVYGAVAELTSLDDSHQAAALDGIVEEGEEYADGDGPTVFGVAEALYDFTSEVEGDLQFKVGDKIDILEIGENEWYTGRTSDGSIGIFPANYVRIT